MSGRLTEIPTDSCGDLDMGRLEDTLREPTDLVSMMWVNNELGTLFPISSIVEMAHESGVCVHTDAVQALGKVPVDLAETAVDLFSITGHKIYGPKGVAILFVREGTELLPELFGGSQEGGLRPGTSDVGGAVGLACAVELAVGEQAEEAERLSSLRDRLWSGLREQVSDLVLHGDGAERAPHILNIGVPSADSDALIAGLDVEGVAVSSGSACLSGGTEPSHVIQALYRDTDPLPSIRFSLGKLVGEDEIEAALERTSRVFGRLRETSQGS
jgi:cysteine desulfurase